MRCASDAVQDRATILDLVDSMMAEQGLVRLSVPIEQTYDQLAAGIVKRSFAYSPPGPWLTILDSYASAIYDLYFGDTDDEGCYHIPDKTRSLGQSSVIKLVSEHYPVVRIEVWDDCYINLSLYENGSELGRIEYPVGMEAQDGVFQRQLTGVADWLKMTCAPSNWIYLSDPPTSEGKLRTICQKTYDPLSMLYSLASLFGWVQIDFGYTKDFEGQWYMTIPDEYEIVCYGDLSS